MSKRFELHLEGVDEPEGLIDADHLVDIVGSLQQMATRLGRIETHSARLGRPNRGLNRVARLHIGLGAGSRTIVAERAVAADTFDLEVPDEEAVDRRLAELLEGVGAGRRPDWVSDSLAIATDGLVIALQRAAPRVELRVDGITTAAFETRSLDRETWKVSTPPRAENEVTFTGRLREVQLSTHQLEVEDGAGRRVALPSVADDAAVEALIGQYVNVVGSGVYDLLDNLAEISEATLQLVPDPLRGPPAGAGTALADLLASAPGPASGGFVDLSDAEFASFLEAARG